MFRSRSALAAPFTLAAATIALAACQSVNPFGSSSAYRSHCRAALDYLVARETEKTKISIETDSERERDSAMAVTMVYVQGESRRLFTCLYQPDKPGRLIGASYRGQGMTQAQIDEINGAVGRR